MVHTLFLTDTPNFKRNIPPIRQLQYRVGCGQGVWFRRGQESGGVAGPWGKSLHLLSSLYYPLLILCYFILSTTSYFIFSFSLKGSDGLPAATLPWTERKAGTNKRILKKLWVQTLKCVKNWFRDSPILIILHSTLPLKMPANNTAVSLFSYSMEDPLMSV